MSQKIKRNAKKEAKKERQKKKMLAHVEKEPLNFDYPVFCFKYLHPNFNLTKCKDMQLLNNLIARLQKLSKIGFSGIKNSDKHGYGNEPIPIEQIKIQNFPEIIPEDVKKLDIYRASGNNLPFAVYRRPNTNVLHIIAISCKFNSLYNH